MEGKPQFILEVLQLPYIHITLSRGHISYSSGSVTEIQEVPLTEIQFPECYPNTGKHSNGPNAMNPEKCKKIQG